VIIHFMDAWNFDVRSAKKCCVHHVLPDGKIIPFCSYNTLHRPRYMHKTRTPAHDRLAALSMAGTDLAGDGAGSANEPAGG
jgi:hypothetical protein